MTKCSFGNIININKFIFIVLKRFKGVKVLGTVIDKMTNNIYKVLKYMYTRQIDSLTGEKYIPLSQVEIAEVFGMSTITANKLFKQLRDDDLLHPLEGKRGKYKFSDKALIILKDMEKLENKLEEVK